MARNGSGEYSLPANTAAVSGATISSTKFNSIMSDLESTLNTARPVVKGGTGATTASAARANLGLAIGTDVQAHDAFLDDIAALTDPGADSVLVWNDTSNAVEFLAQSSFLRADNNLSDLASASTARSNLGLGTMAVEAAADYLALTGGTLTGNMVMQKSTPIFDFRPAADTETTRLRFLNTAGSLVGAIRYQYSDGSLLFRDASSNLMVLSSSGDLSVVGGLSVNTSGSNASFSGADELSLRNTSGDVGMTFWSAATGRALVCFADPTGGNVNNRLEVYSDDHASSANDWVFLADSAEFMRWDDSATALEVTGRIEASNTLRVFDGTATYASEAAKTALFKSGVTNGAADVLIIDQDNNSGRPVLQLQGAAGAVEVAWFGSNGEIGFGTTSPNETLHVNGETQTKSPVVTTSGTLSQASHLEGHVINMNGDVTLPTAAAGCHVVLVAAGGTRTITRGSGLALYVNGTNTASVSLADRKACSVVYTSGSSAYLTGDVT